MFNKLSLLALLAPLVAGLTVETPKNSTAGGPVTILWNSNPRTDPSIFSILLLNAFLNDAFAIANNVETALGHLTLTLPIVPAADGYIVQFVSVKNINNAFASSGTFSIGANGETPVSSGSTSL